MQSSLVRRVRIVAAFAAALAVHAASAYQSFDGVQFIDRSVSGEIVLGPPAGGVSVIDFDRDGWMDLVMGRTSAPLSRLYHNVPDANTPGGRTFVDVTIAAGLADADATGRTPNGIVVGDYDNDGWDDVFICGSTSISHGLLYRNAGDGTFWNVSIAAGVRGSATADAAAWVDYDLDGRLDLMISLFTSPWFRLLHNEGDGTFSDASAILPPRNISSRPYCHAFFDFDDDGYFDFYGLSRNGLGTEMLWRNVDDGAGGRAFVNIAQQVGYVSHGPAPMGIAFGDMDGDGDFDIGISDAVIGTFYRRDPTGYTKVQPMSTMFGWGVDWLDVENDGDLDFFTAGSYGSSRPDNLQLNNNDGTFTNISAVLNGVAAPSRYALQMDFDNDGRRDLISLGISQLTSIYHNNSANVGHWLEVALVGDGCRVNSDAANAIIRVIAGGQSQLRAVLNGSSTTSREDPRQHFGLGDTTVIDAIEVIWPRRGTLADRTEVFEGPFAADQLITLTPQAHVGDANCDGAVDFYDIDAFVAALGDPDGACRFIAVDANNDGAVNFFDIDPFVEALAGGCP